MTSESARRILCFGNDLHGDDGFGPALGAQLARRGMPAGWTLHLVGTRGLDALALLLDCEAAIVVDAEAPAGQPGRLRERSGGELNLESSRVGHGMGLAFVLQALHHLVVQPPALRILTAEMADARSFQPALSPAVADCLETAERTLRAWMAPAASTASQAIEPNPPY